MKLKKIKDFIDKGMIDSMDAKKQFERDYARVSDNILKQKEAMREKSKNRNLIRNK